LLEIVCVITLSSSLKKVYSVNFNLSAREKYSDNFLIDDHTHWSKQDFGKLLSRLNSKEKSLQNNPELKVIIESCGIKARFNIGKINKSLVTTFAPVGGQVFPISAQDYIFDPLYESDYSDFDISKHWSAKNKKDIAMNGRANYLIAACFASESQLVDLHSRIEYIGTSWFWERHHWHNLKTV